MTAAAPDGPTGPDTETSPSEKPRIWAKTSRSKTAYTVNVSSAPADGMTVWHVRDFVRALDAAEIPDGAKVLASSSPERGLTGLRVHHDVTVKEAVND
jgi:hypothetical protein